MKKGIEQKDNEQLPRLVGFREVKRLTGLSRPTVWRLEREGAFPKRRRLTSTKVSWLLSEVLQWIAERTPVESEAKAAPKSQQPEASQTVRRPTSWMDRDDE